MKISKSKQELARIISENGGWRSGAEWAALEQQGGDVWLCAIKPLWCVGVGIFSFKDHVKTIPGSYKLPNIHQAILSRAEYLHLYPAPDADGWIEWKGGECPVEKGTLVDVIWRNGTERAGVKALHIGGAGHKFWVADGMANDIIAYRLHKPEQAKPEFRRSVGQPITGPEIQSEIMGMAQVDNINVVESKPTIEQLAADYRNAKNCADRKQQEADDAKADVGAKLKALNLAGKEYGLLVSPITAKQDPEPELVIKVQVGDEVECIKSNVTPDNFRGMIGTVLKIDCSSTPYLVDFGRHVKIWCYEVKFIRRP